MFTRAERITRAVVLVTAVLVVLLDVFVWRP